MAGEIRGYVGRVLPGGDGFVQDPCHRTVALDQPTDDGLPEDLPGVWRNPTFAFGPLHGDLAWAWGFPWGVSSIFDEVTLDGAFAATGDGLGCGRFDGRLNVLPIHNMMAPIEDQWEMACEGMADLGMECVDCSDGTPPCVPFSAHDIQGPQIDVVFEHPETGVTSPGLAEISYETYWDWYHQGLCP